MSTSTVVALVLALLSTMLTNLAYLREHDAAAALPPCRCAIRCIRCNSCVDDRNWLLGFAMESAGFLLYAAALALGSLALVQSIGAGGIGVLAYVSAHRSNRQLSRRELSGVIVSVVGLLALGISLAGGSGAGRERLDRGQFFCGSARPVGLHSSSCCSSGPAWVSRSPLLSPEGSSSRSETSRPRSSRKAAPGSASSSRSSSATRSGPRCSNAATKPAPQSPSRESRCS